MAEGVAVVDARLRNVPAICNAMPPQRSAEFVGELRSALEGPIAKQNGVVAMVRPDSILAVFSMRSVSAAREAPAA